MAALSSGFPGVYLQEAASRAPTIGGASTSVAAFVGYLPGGAANEPTRVFSFAEFSRIFGGLHADSETSYAVQQFFLNGGSEAWIVRVDKSPTDTDYVEAVAPGDESGGIYALKGIEPETFNNLCLPDGIDFSNAVASALYPKATSFCGEHNAFLIIDPPETISDTGLSAWADPIRDKNAAMYFPLLDMPDPLDEYKPRKVGASGTLAGIYARTDAGRGVWKAPAGTEARLRGAAPSQVVSDGQNGVLNKAGINVIRSFPGYGPVSWGARTLVGNNEGDDKYVPVRRMTLFLKQSLQTGLKWAVFEPNGEQLWAAIRLTVESFLNGLYRQGAFKGATAREAYFVLCDETTTSADDIAGGFVNVLVGFAPLNPAEFVVVELKQMAAQAQS
jgi:phage tail sheath protein FI